MMPAISIIVPIYNTKPYLRQCLDSILAQTFTNFEVILVNDGSTDGSGIICDEYIEKDSRVRVKHKKYGGVSSARNVGIQIAKGEYIGFVDGDDYIDKEMYHSLYKLCVETESDISICKLGREIKGKLVNKNKDDDEEQIREMDHNEAMSELFKGILYRFSLCNKLIKKSCFNQVYFPEGRIHEDLSTTYRLFANSKKAVYKNYIGYIYVKRENSILTSAYNEKRLDAFMGWNEILPFMISKYTHLLTEVMASYGYWCVDNIYYILNQIKGNEERGKYLNRIKIDVNKYYKFLIKNDTLPLKHKFIITLLKYNGSLLLFFNNVKNLSTLRKHLLGEFK